MAPLRKKAVTFLTLAVCCAFVAFYALFAGGLNHAIAFGILILGLLGFGVFYSKGFDLWEASAATNGAAGAGSESGIQG